MLFSCDKQTVQDLGIFDNYSDHSVFSLFNRCATRGGAAVLEDMFLHPLTDRTAIEERVRIFRYFSQANIPFPVTGVLLDAIEPYLHNRDERTRVSAMDNSLGKKLGNLIASNAEVTLVHKGINALVELVKEVAIFLHVAATAEYAAGQQAMKAILEMPAFARVLNRKGKSKLTPEELEVFDGIFRFKYREEIQELLRQIYLLDVYMTVGRVAALQDFVFPESLSAGDALLELEGAFHPGLKKPVANSIHISAANNVIFLTGANMAGKSTFMKTLGIALYLAHMGFPVPAARIRFQVLDGMYTTINLPDNLGMGASHFYAEVLRVKKMAQELSMGKKLFIVFDELFRGTNVKDAYEATIAVTAGFALKTESIFVISTHIIEAGDVLRKSCSNIHFVYLPTRMNGNMPVYTYQLEQGITADRHGMVIIQNERILDILQQGKKSG